MNIPNSDKTYFDDRTYVLQVESVKTRSLMSNEPAKKEWAVTIRRNIPGYPPYRTDTFPSRIEAINYYKAVAPKTPRISLGNQSPKSIPSLNEYISWLVAESLYDPILNPRVTRS